MQVQGAHSAAVQASAFTPARAASVRRPQPEARIPKKAAPVVSTSEPRQIESGLSVSQYAGSQVSALPRVDIDVQRVLAMTAQLLNHMQASRAYGPAGPGVSRIDLQA